MRISPAKYEAMTSLGECRRVCVTRPPTGMSPPCEIIITDRWTGSVYACRNGFKHIFETPRGPRRLTRALISRMVIAAAHRRKSHQAAG